MATTGALRPHAPHPRGRFAEKIVEHFDLGHLFERVYGADLGGEFDDKGLLIEHIIGVEQIGPTRMAMGRNRANDMLAASHHTSSGSLWGYGSEEEFTQAGAAVLCSSPDDLVEVDQGLLQV